MIHAVFESAIPYLNLIHRGKVRDIYALDEQHMLIVATDRLSAFDVILPQPIPGKGAVLTRVANFWFNKTHSIIGNHLSGLSVSDVLNTDDIERLGDRVIIVKKLRPLPIEAIVRGFVIGSGWKDYQRTGAICGITLPKNLQQADALDEVIYTPSSKAAMGDHDENIRFEDTVALIGADLAKQVRASSIAIYTMAAQYARARGIIIADTKFEFGLDEHNQLHLIDEVLTPDSSRFWPASEYRPGISPPSFDKQFVRDYLETLDWDKTPPGPTLPDQIISKTAEKYAEAERILTA